MRRLWRWFAAGIVLLIIAVAAGVLVPRPFVPVSAAIVDSSSKTRTVLLLSNPIHTDIAFRVDDDLRQRFAFLEDAGLPLGEPAVRWLVIGWGGRSFYIETPTWADLKPIPVFKALTVDSAVMHSQLTGDIDFSHDAVTPLEVTGRRYKAMLDCVLEQYELDSAGKPVPVPDSAYGAFDAFHEADGWFNALVGCNTWSASVLRRGGFRTGLWNPLPFLLCWSVTLHNACDEVGCKPDR